MHGTRDAAQAFMTMRDTVRENEVGPLHARTLLRAHATFLTAFGAWPNLHMRSFEAVTGKKVDTWLVRSVGLLLVGAGTSMNVTRPGGELSASTRALAMGVSGSLAAISLTYASRGRIPKVYFLDAALHLAFVSAWAATFARRGHTRPAATT